MRVNRLPEQVWKLKYEEHKFLYKENKRQNHMSLLNRLFKEVIRNSDGTERKVTDPCWDGEVI